MYLSIVGMTVVLIVAGLFVFYDFMGAYENAQPQNTADAYAESISEDALIKLVTESLDKLDMKYEKAETFTDIFRDAYAKNAPKAQKLLTESTSDSPVYSIICGETQVCKITLSKDGEGKYRFDSWRVENVVASTEGIVENGVEYSVYVPHGADFTLNGIIPDVTEESVEYPFGTELENATLPSADLYELGTLYSEPEFSCKSGEADFVSINKEGVVYFLPEGFSPTNYTIKAPSGASVYVNGILLSEDYITESKKPYEYSALETDSTTLPTYDVYETGELFYSPKVSCDMNGIGLTSSGTGASCTFDYPKELMYTLTLKVPSGAAVSVSGHDLTGVITPSSESAFEGLIADSVDAPMFDVYVIENLYSPVTGVSATLDGTELTFSDVSVGNSLKFVSDHSGVIDEAVSAYAIEFMKAYFFYTSEGSRNVDENLAATLVYVDPTSNLYTKIKESRIGYYYLTPVISQVYNKLEASQMYLLADGSYIVKLDFDITQTHYGGIKEHSGEISLHITGTGDSLKISDMVIDAE